MDGGFHSHRMCVCVPHTTFQSYNNVKPFKTFFLNDSVLKVIEARFFFTLMISAIKAHCQEKMYMYSEKTKKKTCSNNLSM